MNILSILGVILLLAFLVEALVEYVFGTLADKVPALQKHKWVIMYIALAVGIVGAFIYDFDLMYLLGQWLGADIVHSNMGIVLTGLAIGRGSNFIHDLVQRFFASNEPKG